MTFSKPKLLVLNSHSYALNLFWTGVTYNITQEGREYFDCAECENLNEEVCEYPLRSRVKQRMELRSCLQFNDRNVIVLQLYLVVGSNGRVLGYRLEDSQQLTVNDQKCLETQISNLIFIENENGVECGAYTLKIMRQNE